MVDFGMVFGVLVFDDGVMDVVVFEGEVEVKLI